MAGTRIHVYHERAATIGDLVRTEPLPADHPLWTAPGVLISPHIAGHGERSLERLSRPSR